MSIVVQKYGGSSVADVGKLRYVAERVMQTARRGHQVVVVVSAMGDTTDELLAMAKQLSPNPERRELDMLLSAGERISMALLSMAIRELGGDAISFTGSQSGIITNDRHVDARIIEVRPFRVQDELARGRIVVVAGYQGVSYKREVTTLGRGGSDTTAVAMAAALDAEYCEICSDVDGVYSADPRVVPAATADRHALLRGNAGDGRGRSEGPERAGGRIRQGEGHRHLRARDAGAGLRVPTRPLMARSFGRTRRGCRAPSSASPASATCSVLDGSAPPADVVALLAERRVPGKQLHVFEGRTTVAISRENLHDEGQLREALQTRLGGRARLVDSLAALSAIGAGINATYDNVLAGSATLAGIGIVPAGIATSSFRITWLVPADRVNEAVRALHERFIERQRPLVP